jgi:hypothetical protein
MATATAMYQCVRLRGHEGPCKSRDGTEWGKRS